MSHNLNVGHRNDKWAILIFIFKITGGADLPPSPEHLCDPGHPYGIGLILETLLDTSGKF